MCHGTLEEQRAAERWWSDVPQTERCAVNLSFHWLHLQDMSNLGTVPSEAKYGVSFWFGILWFL